MRLATGLSLFVASALATLALADIPAESTVYVIYREEGTGGCISTGSPGILNDVVGIRGFVLDEEYSLVGGRSEETGTCAEEMACFVAPLSEACLNLERTFEAFGEIIAQDVPPTTSASLVVPGAQEDDTNNNQLLQLRPQNAISVAVLPSYMWKQQYVSALQLRYHFDIRLGQ